MGTLKNKICWENFDHIISSWKNFVPWEQHFFRFFKIAKTKNLVGELLKQKNGERLINELLEELEKWHSS